ncbi:MAG: thioesterase family protein [Microthrixaceae bacterium]
MGSLGQDTELLGSNGSYTVTPSEDWRIWGPMGGYAASLALRAAANHVPADCVPASFSCQFFTPARFEPVDLEVVLRRSTRRTTAAAVTMTQNGKPVLDAQSWFALEDEHVSHDHTTVHPHGDPFDHPDITELTDEKPPFPFWENFEGRPVDWVHDWDSYMGGEPTWAEWLRFLPDAEFGDPVLEACRLLIMADLPSFPAASRAHPGASAPQWIAPNLDLSVQFHRLAGLGEWLLSSGVAPIAERGLIGFRSEVWTRDGLLAATGSGQLLTKAV